MADNKPKIYSKGFAKEIGTFGTVSASFNLEQLKQYVDQKGYVKVLINKRREPDSNGNTHYITIEQSS